MFDKLMTLSTYLTKELEGPNDVSLVFRPGLEKIKHGDPSLDVVLSYLHSSRESGSHVEMNAVMDGESSEGLGSADFLQVQEQTSEGGIGRLVTRIVMETLATIHISPTF